MLIKCRRRIARRLAIFVAASTTVRWLSGDGNVASDAAAAAASGAVID